MASSKRKPYGKRVESPISLYGVGEEAGPAGKRSPFPHSDLSAKEMQIMDDQWRDFELKHRSTKRSSKNV